MTITETLNFIVYGCWIVGGFLGGMSSVRLLHHYLNLNRISWLWLSLMLTGIGIAAFPHVALYTFWFLAR